MGKFGRRFSVWRLVVASVKLLVYGLIAFLLWDAQANDFFAFLVVFIMLFLLGDAIKEFLGAVGFR